MIMNVEFSLKPSNYTSWNRAICLKGILKNVYNTAYSVQSPYIGGHSL